MARVSIVRWNLKEAGGKSLRLRTGTISGGSPAGDAAKQAKAQYCTEQRNVNIEAGWAESRYAYPERSDDNLAEVRASAEAKTTVRINNNSWYHQKSAEAIVSRKRVPTTEKSHKRMKG
jgi:hypothetical protein